MQKYFAVLTLILLVSMVIIRVLMLKKKGIKAMHFGKTDKRDFLIPPFALIYFYLIIASAFNLPAIKQVLFRNEIVSWAGVLLCLLGLILLLWSLISFRNSFRVGIDENVSNGLITTGVFAFSRNPVYTAFGLVLFGQFFVYSSWILLVYIIAGIWLFHRQVLLEEGFLTKHYGKEYIEYCKRVRRYI
jgi:protein-S-isoprenylcysteine O-methyltransferase Ste14